MGFPVPSKGFFLILRHALISNFGGIATILAHPLCMEVADGMVKLENLCQFLQSFPNCWVSEVGGVRG